MARYRFAVAHRGHDVAGLRHDIMSPRRTGRGKRSPIPPVLAVEADRFRALESAEDFVRYTRPRRDHGDGSCHLVQEAQVCDLGFRLESMARGGGLELFVRR